MNKQYEKIYAIFFHFLTSFRKYENILKDMRKVS